MCSNLNLHGGSSEKSYLKGFIKIMAEVCFRKKTKSHKTRVSHGKATKGRVSCTKYHKFKVS